MSLIVAGLVIGCVALSWALLGNLGGMVSFGHAPSSASAPIPRPSSRSSLACRSCSASCWAASARCSPPSSMLPVLRLRGPYFALAILAYAHIFRILATEWTSLTGGSGGIAASRPADHPRLGPQHARPAPTCS
jgi:branched-chain amino acid transport system permease protein